VEPAAYYEAGRVEPYGSVSINGRASTLTRRVLTLR